MKKNGRKIIGTTGKVAYTGLVAVLLISIFSIPQLKDVAHILSHNFDNVMKQIDDWQNAKV